MAARVPMWLGTFVFAGKQESSLRPMSQESSNIRRHAVFGNRMEGEEKTGWKSKKNAAKKKL